MDDNLGLSFKRCLALSLFVFSLSSGAPEYQFPFGRIQGSDQQAEDTLTPYNAYYGIPFAQPPIGDLRFRAPQPFSNRNPDIIISSARFRPACIQAIIPPSQTPTSEDCLHLNIFTPTSDNSGGPLKKVMVWIHGGGYFQGKASDFIPSRLVTDYDVIVVTLQYRLGAFGFLFPGNGRETNFGLRDQIMGIQWVKDNIRAFGGDGNDITIFGQSAGSISVSFLSLSPLSKGLFTKAILQSGAAASTTATSKTAQKKFVKLSSTLGCSSWIQQLSFLRDYYIDDVMNCLRRKQATEILFPPSAQNTYNNANENNNPPPSGEPFSFLFSGESVAPSVDGVVLPRSPESLLADKAYLESNGVLDRKYLLGINNNEGLLFVVIYLLTSPNADSVDYDVFSDPKKGESYVKEIASTMYTTPVTDDVMDFVVYEYTYPRDNQGQIEDLNVINAFSDVMYVLPPVQFARALASQSDTTPVYLYLFDHYPEVRDPNSPIKGSTHGLELAYEFDRNPGIGTLFNFYVKTNTPTDQPLYNIFRNSLTQFAKTGVPSSQEYTSWPRFRPDDESYLAIDTTPEVKRRPFAKRIDLWTKYLPLRTGGYRSRPLKLY